jgi:hypothetical protein
MQVKHLKKYLAGIPDDYEVEVSKMFVVAGKNKKETRYVCILDRPVVGIAHCDKSRHVRFVLYSTEMTKRERKMYSRDMGKIRKIK